MATTSSSAPVQKQSSITSSNTAATNCEESKWNTLRRAVRKQALQLVGLEHPESLQQHQDAVQRSIVVGRISRDLVRDPASQQSIQPSLVQAIVPHETVSPIVTHNLLRHLASVDSFSQPSSATSTPMSTMKSGLHPLHLDDIELQNLAKERQEEQPKPLLESSASEPSFNRIIEGVHKTRPPDLEKSLSVPTDVLMSVQGTLPPPPSYLSHPTGRLQSLDVSEQEAKPDLWKIAYYGIKYLSRGTSSDTLGKSCQPVKTGQIPKSFDIDEISDDDEDSEEDQDSHPLVRPPLRQQSSVASTISSRLAQTIQDHSFFGHEVEYTDGTLQRHARYTPRTVEGEVMEIITEEEEEDFIRGDGRGVEFGTGISSYPSYIATGVVSPPPTSPIRGTLQRRRTILSEGPQTDLEVDSSKQYRPPFKVLGGHTLRLLNFRYKHVPRSTHQKLDELEKQGFHRPFFTYWLMTVHVTVLVFTLIVYGFAPYGFDQFTERSLVQQSNLAVEVVERIIVPNVWGGPPQSALVLLGATYGPCMRRDRQLYEGVDQDMFIEANTSGCCVRRDQSGCVQVQTSSDCPSAFADFVFFDPTVNTSDSPFTDRAVCGTSPLTCVNPPSRDSRWESSDITNWPICAESQTVRGQSPHLTCNITGRPCCVGIQAQCIVTTQEHCDYLRGRFHPEAFLCAQVDCLDDACGLLPFVSMNRPDQVYRLWTAIFLHAGIVHLVFTLVFHFLILRHVEKYLGWLPTSVIYIGSSIGGNVVSIVFIPYNPEVGPAGGIFGVIAFFLIYIMYQAHRLLRPWVEALKLLLVLLVLVGCGLFPFIDNYAHFGGLVFGFFLSGIFVPYYRPNQAELEYYRKKYGKDFDTKKDWIQISKYVFLSFGSLLLVVLYTLFLVLFYVVQDNTWEGFSFLNCIPFTGTFCIDLQQNIRSRDIIY